MIQGKRDPRPLCPNNRRMRITPYQPGDHNPEVGNVHVLAR